MRIYQPTKHNQYILPTNLYRQMVYIVRDYDRLAEEHHEALHTSTTLCGTRATSGRGDPVAVKAIRRERLWREIEAVDKALLAIPAEYRRGVARHVKYGERWPDCAHRNTWNRYKSEFLYHVAENLGKT